MAKRSSGILGAFNSMRPLTKLFYLTAAVVLLVVPTAIQFPQNLTQEASGRNNRYSITPVNANLVFGGSVSFAVSGRNVETGTMWFVNSCAQNGTEVYKQYLKISTTGQTGPFTLGPTPSWSSGGADCTGTVGFFQKGTTFRSQGSIFYTVSP